MMRSLGRDKIVLMPDTKRHGHHKPKRGKRNAWERKVVSLAADAL